MKNVDGKVAFITGGSSGIGLGIAHAFVDAGMKVVITYRTKEHLDEAMAHLGPTADRVHAIYVDVTDRQGMERAAAQTVERFGKVNVLVNNAGVTTMSTLTDTSYEDWDWLMGVNLNGVFHGIRAFLPHIRRQSDGGHILATSSVLGLCVAGYVQGAYYVSKFALVGMMEALRAELADTNIGVSVLCPGLVKSQLIDSKRDTSRYTAISRSAKNSPISTDPLEVGRLTLQGMQNDDLYIITHPEFQPLIERRNEAIIASIPRHPHPPNARIEMVRSLLHNSIYARRCGAGTPNLFAAYLARSTAFPPERT